MLTKIRAALKHLEEIEEIHILYACESGSRAWGFASESSDYDVRFIYGRHWKKRFTILGYRDVIDRTKSMVSSDYIRSLEKENIDLSGWDIIKVMELMLQGNPALAEWFQSPIIYSMDNIVYPWMKQMSTEFFKSKAGIYHYIEMASRNFTQYINNVEGEVILKKYLYVLRPLYACAWLMVFDVPPPMCFKDIYTNDTVNSYLTSRSRIDIRPYLESLIQKKQSGDELGRAPHIKQLDDVIYFWLTKFKESAQKISVIKISDDKIKDINNQLAENIAYISEVIKDKKEGLSCLSKE